MSRQPRSYVRPAEVGVPYALVGVALIAGAIAVPGFLSPSHLSSMSVTAAYIGIIAIGETLVLLLGGIDLSVPYMINLAAVLLAGLQFENVSAGSDFVIVLLVGLGAGLVNGLGIALLDISPLVMTLGMNSILAGVVLIYTSGSPMGSAPAFVTTLSTGTGTAGIPYVDILWIALIVVVTLVLVFTRFGRSIYSIGANRKASELSGLPVRRTIIVAYALSGLSGALGGVLLAGYSGQAYLGMGDNYLLPAIAVVVIGGTSIFGGKGSYVQTVAGALLITVITSALITIQVDQAGQDILYGAIILLMAYFNQVAVSRQVTQPRWLAKGPKAFRGWLEPARPPGEAGVRAPELAYRPNDDSDSDNR
jgi:ribose transport system permease protein